MKAQNRLKRLEPVIRVTKQREQEAAKTLAAQVSVLREAEATLAQLTQHRAGYVRVDVNGGFDARRWQDYHEFIDKLDQAIAAQQSVIDDQEQRVALARQTWSAAHSKVLAFSKLTRKLSESVETDAERIAQRELDEYAGQQTLRAPGHL